LCALSHFWFQAETEQSEACKKFEKISEVAKGELQDLKKRRLTAFKKNLIDFADLEVKHAKSSTWEIKTLKCRSSIFSGKRRVDHCAVVGNGFMVSLCALLVLRYAAYLSERGAKDLISFLLQEMSAALLMPRPTGRISVWLCCVEPALGTSTMESSKINFFEVWDSEWNLRTLDCEEWVKPIATLMCYYKNKARPIGGGHQQR
uniref:Polyprotein n=1 Tax=Ascaris lumbricoides TaxID=6252 RepID=A0A0M3IF32_ASCLU